MTDPRFVPPGPYRDKLLREKFVPWPLQEFVARDYSKGVGPPSTWGNSVGVGFVSDARFARSGSEQVIKRTNRAVTKKWRQNTHQAGT